MKNFYRLGSLLVLTLVFFLLLSTAALAVDAPKLQYNFGVVLTPDQCSSGTCSWISVYIAALYRLGVGLAAVLAVVGIMTGGFIWLASAGAADKVKMGQGIIWSSLSGLALALFSYLILYTVNPKLTSLDPLHIPVITPTSGNLSGTQNSGTNAIIGGKSESQMRELFASIGAFVPKEKPPCAPGQTTNCVNLAGLPNDAYLGLKRLTDGIGNDERAGRYVATDIINITGGTEAGHNSHHVGLAVVDIRNSPTLISYVQTNGTHIDGGVGFGTSAYSIGDDLYVLEGDHWHVEFNDANGRLNRIKVLQESF